MRATGRTVALAGAVVAVGAATLMGVTAGSAAAAAPGTCTQNVNVRAEPRMDAEIVAICQAGTEVETGRTQNGFVQLTDLRGWASEDFVRVGDGAAGSSGATPSGSGSPSATPAPSDSEPPSGENPTQSPERATGSSATPTTSSSADDDQDQDQADEESLEDESPAGGGLLGG